MPLVWRLIAGQLSNDSESATHHETASNSFSINLLLLWQSGSFALVARAILTASALLLRPSTPVRVAGALNQQHIH